MKQNIKAAAFVVMMVFIMTVFLTMVIGASLPMAAYYGAIVSMFALLIEVTIIGALWIQS